MFSLLSRAASFLYKIYMSRALGAEVVGLYQICISVYCLILSFTAGGLPTVLSRRIAETEVSGDKARQKRLMSASLIIVTVLCSVVIALGFVLRDKLSFIFTDDRCVDMFLIMLPAILTSSVYAIIRAWFWGRKSFLAFSFTEFLDNLMKIAFSVLFVGGIISGIVGATGIALAFTLADCICVLILFILYFKNGGRLGKPAEYASLTKSFLPITTMHITGSVIGSLTAIVIPMQLVAIGFSSADATATFGRIAGMALPLLMAPTTLTGALAVVLIPEMASYAAQGDVKSLVAKLENSIVFCFFVASAFLVLYAPLGEQIGNLLFGDRTAGIYVAQCCLLMFPVSLNQVTAPVVNALGMEKKCFFNYLVGIVIVIPCIFLLPYVIGIYAMAVGSVLCFTVSAVLNLRCLRKRIGVPICAAKKSSLLVLSCAMPTLLTFFLKGIISHYLPEALVIILAGGIGVAAYVLFTSAFKLVRVDSFIAIAKNGLMNRGLLKRKANARKRKFA